MIRLNFKVYAVITLYGAALVKVTPGGSNLQFIQSPNVNRKLSTSSQRAPFYITALINEGNLSKIYFTLMINNFISVSEQKLV